MTASFRSELMKLRRPRVLYGALGGLFGCTILVTVLTFATATAPPARLTAGFTNASRLVGVVVLVMFLTNVTTEYSLGTLRTLLLRRPLRDRLLAGKVLALGACTAGALLVALAVSLASAAVVTGVRGTPTGPWLADAATGYANTVLAAACYGSIGLALGVLLRSTPLAVGVALFWFVMVENIARNTWPGAGHVLPGLLAGAVTGVPGSVPYSHGLAGVLVYSALSLTAGFVVFARRDVST
ncbi:ABC transporter permease subunit [Dactylosporangium sp. NPDC049525]|uniref:ABC transporter permease subunit n=1 Tax=Dactylosporangium sp. NPDC049525 TaxID=3154730 RepID=UPI003418E129